MATTKTLRLTFKNAKDKKVNLSLAEAAEDLTAEEVKNAMCEANIFAKEEVDQYQVPLSAQYVERTTTSVFDDSKQN